MGNERFSVPEVIFTPQDIGINEAGLPEAIWQSVNKCPKLFEKQLYKNVIISGGNTLLRGFKDRLEFDLQGFKPNECTAEVNELQTPQHAAWKGLKTFCSNKTNFEDFVVTKREYQEEGFRILKKFYL